MSKSFINAILVVMVSIVMSGCSMLQSGAESLAEPPTLENQANRIVVGMGLIRTNTVIANMPISADATWPEELNDEATLAKNMQIISDALEDDPYVATHQYTDLWQKSQLGGYAFLNNPKIGSLTYNALNRAVVLYGEDEANWPTFFDIETDLATFHKFKDGKVKEVEATTCDVYPNISDAIIALMPVNYQKDLHGSKEEMIKAFFEVADVKAQIGKNETRIDTNDEPVEDENGNVQAILSEQEILDLKQENLSLETTLSELEIVADEKELIYTTLLDEATKALESDIQLNEGQVKLAKNIVLASGAIKQGALDAGGAFALTTGILASTNIVQDFPKELVTLAAGRGSIPSDKLDLYDQRVARITKNALYSIPAIAIGTYYAFKQAFLAERYETIAEIIVEADALQREADQAELERLAAAETTSVDTEAEAATGK